MAREKRIVQKKSWMAVMLECLGMSRQQMAVALDWSWERVNSASKPTAGFNIRTFLSVIEKLNLSTSNANLIMNRYLSANGCQKS